jgi:hypothetical protein
MLVDFECSKCGEVFTMDIHDKTLEEVQEDLKKKEGFHCPGNHVELGSPANHWVMMPESLREGSAPTEEEFLADLKSQKGEVYTTQELDSSPYEITSFAYCTAIAYRRDNGDKVYLDFTHSPKGTRYYYPL